MTNEEVIERIKSHKFWLKINDPKATSILVALDMATRSLMRQKTGRWIRCDILQEFKCSECRVCFRNKSNYCPNCGAKMTESEVKK